MQAGDFLSTGGNLYEEAIHRGTTREFCGEPFFLGPSSRFLSIGGGGGGEGIYITIFTCYTWGLFALATIFQSLYTEEGDVPGTPP